MIVAITLTALLAQTTSASASASEQQRPGNGYNAIYYGAECNPVQANGSISTEVNWHYYGNGFRVTRLAFWNGTNHIANIQRVFLIDNNGNRQIVYPEPAAPHNYSILYVDFITPSPIVRVTVFEYLATFTGYCGGSAGANLVISAYA
ncbi:hypothetical protein GCM10009734_26480 [Nonomuraea bangladeshensis]